MFSIQRCGWALAFLCSSHYPQLTANIVNAEMFTFSGVEL